MTIRSPLLVFIFLTTLFGQGCGHTGKVETKARRVKASNFAATATETRPPEFTFGPGDEIDISVWRHEDLNMKIKISPDGAISYPLVGRLKIGGMTYPELISILREKISKYYIDPQVSINILKVSNMKVFVLGEVNIPSVLQIESQMTILEAIARAGGITKDSKTGNVLLIRGGMERPTLILVNLNKIVEEGDMGQNLIVQRGDIIYVPETTISKAERYFKKIYAIISPFVSGTAAYRNLRWGGVIVDGGE